VYCNESMTQNDQGYYFNVNLLN